MGTLWFDPPASVHIPDFTPRYYQTDAFNAVVAEERKGVRSTFVVLPTATGKTELMVMLARHRYEYNRGKTLILAATDEVVGQAFRKLEMRGIEPALEKADEKAVVAIRDAAYDRWNPRDIYAVAGSVQTLHKRRLEKYWPRDFFDQLIFDECHHAVTPSYMKIMEHFHSAFRVGVTATGARLKPKKARSAFETKAYELPLQEAIDNRFVKRFSPRKSKQVVDITGIEVRGDDFNISQLSDRISPEIERLANAVREQIGGRQTIVFTPASSEGALASPAQIWAEALKKCGISAAAISGKSLDRNELLGRFRAKDIQVLCCCQLLGEGYDNPSVSCIVLARPILSSDFGYQCIGRGLRPYDEYDDCLIIDFCWGTDNLRLFQPIDIFTGSEDAKISPAVSARAQTLLDDGDVGDISDALQFAQEIEDRETAKREAAKREEQRLRDLRLSVKKRKSNMEFDDVDLGRPRNFADWLIGVEVRENYVSRRMPISVRQYEMLLKKGVTEEEMRGITRRKMNAWVDWVMDRNRAGLATYKQVKALIGSGVPKETALRYTFQAAGRFFEDRRNRKRRRAI